MGLKEQWDEGPSVHRDRIDVTGFNEFYAGFVRLILQALRDRGTVIVDTPAYQRLNRIAGGQETFFPPGEETNLSAPGNLISTMFVRLLDDFSIPNIAILLPSSCTTVSLFIGPWVFATKDAVEPDGFIQFGAWLDDEPTCLEDGRITSLDEAIVLEARAREITQLFAALSQRNLLGPKTFKFPSAP